MDRGHADEGELNQAFEMMETAGDTRNPPEEDSNPLASEDESILPSPAETTHPVDEREGTTPPPEEDDTTSLPLENSTTPTDERAVPPPPPLALTPPTNDSQMPPPLDEETPLPLPEAELPPPPPDEELPSPQTDIEAPQSLDDSTVPDASIQVDEGTDVLPPTEDTEMVPTYDGEVAKGDLDHPYDEVHVDVDNDNGKGGGMDQEVSGPTTPSSLADTAEPGEDSSIHNASTLPSTHPIGTGNGQANPKQNMNGEMTPEETKKAMKMITDHRREAIMWVAIFIMMASAIVVIFYFTYSIVIAKDDSLPGGAFNVRVAVILNTRWANGLEDSETTPYMNIANEFITGINKTFSHENSSFKRVYLTAQIFSFADEKGFIRASFRSYFTDSPNDVTTQRAFNGLFKSELQAGFNDGYFGTLSLKINEPIMFLNYVLTSFLPAN